MAFCGFLKLGVAVDVLLGPFIDDTTGKDAETGLSIDCEISKNGQGLADKSDATVPVHDSGGTVDGYYNCELDETDTGTLGIITLVAHAAGFLPVRQDYQIVPAIVYDALYAAATTDYLQVDVVQVGGTAQTANDIGADVNDILTDTAVIGALGAGLTALADKTTLDLVHTDVDATLVNQTRIIQILTGKWEITGNQLIMYDSDGTTVLYTFNLTQDGVATEFNPDARIPV